MCYIVNALLPTYICRRKPVNHLRKVQSASSKARQSAAGSCIPRQLTVAALKHFTGMRVDMDVMNFVEKM